MERPPRQRGELAAAAPVCPVVRLVVHLTTAWGQACLGDLTVGEGATVAVGHDGSLATPRWRGRSEPLARVEIAAEGALVRGGEGGPGRRVRPGEVLELALRSAARSPYREPADWEPEPLVLRIEVARGAQPRRRPRSRARALLAASTVVHLLALVASAAVMPQLAPPAEDEHVDDQPYLISTLLCHDGVDAEPEPEPLVRREVPDDMCRDYEEDEASLATSGYDRAPPLGSRASRESWLRAPSMTGDWRPGWPYTGLLFAAAWLPTLGENAPPTWLSSPRGASASPLATCFPELGECSFAADPRLPEPAMVDPLRIGDAATAETVPRRYPSRMRELQVVSALPGWMVRNALRPAVAYGERCWRRALEEAPLEPRTLSVEVSVHANEARASVRGGTGDPVEDALRCCLAHAHDDMVLALPTGATVRARYRLALGAAD